MSGDQVSLELRLSVPDLCLVGLLVYKAGKPWFEPRTR